MFTRFSPLTQETLAIERLFAANSYHGKESNPPVSIIKGVRPIILAAPHAVEHPRHDMLKKADALTGTIATQVALATNCSAIVLSKTMDEDPNYDQAGEFKSILKRITQSNEIVAVINLHGMARTHPWDLVFGSNFGKSLGDRPHLLSQAITSMKSAGFDNYLVDSEDLFAASNPNNISVYSWEHLGVPSFQIEINRNFRDPSHLPLNYTRLVNGLASAVVGLCT